MSDFNQQQYYAAASAAMMYKPDEALDLHGMPGKRGRTRTDRFQKKERTKFDVAVVSLNTAGPVDGYSRQKMLFF